jgi:hypothetical protein
MMKLNERPAESTTSRIGIGSRTNGYDHKHFTKVLDAVKIYFVSEYYAGTREMVLRYVTIKRGISATPQEITACLKILRDQGSIAWEARVWWGMGAI